MKKYFSHLIFVFVIVISLAPFAPAYSAPDKSFTVTVVTDTPDANPGNGKCADSNGNCSLRAAVMEANARAGTDAITLPADTFKLTRSGLVDSNSTLGDLDIEGVLTITGAGKGKTLIDGAGLNERLFEIHPGAVVTLTHMTIANGSEYSDTHDQGGGIRNLGSLTVSNSRVTNSRTSSSGGGIYNAGNSKLNFINSQVDNNYAPLGGGIFNAEDAELVVEFSDVYENSATFGGGISNQKDANASISYSVMYKNGALGGGAIDNLNRTVFMNNSTVRDNHTEEGGSGIYNAAGSTKFVNSTISGNTTCQEGAGVWIYSGEISGYNSTIADNLAGTAAVEDGCLNYGLPKTFTGGGVFQSGGQVDFYNSIIAENQRHNQDGSIVPDDCRGKLATLRYSLLGNTAGCVYTNEGSIVDQSGKLAALADNGGFTRTHALLEGSPAVDAGDPNGCKDADSIPLSTDQRGFPRPFDGDGNGSARCDMGAYEVVKFKSTGYLPILTK